MSRFKSLNYPQHADPVARGVSRSRWQAVLLSFAVLLGCSHRGQDAEAQSLPIPHQLGGAHVSASSSTSVLDEQSDMRAATQPSMGEESVVADKSSVYQADPALNTRDGGARIDKEFQLLTSLQAREPMQEQRAGTKAEVMAEPTIAASTAKDTSQASTTGVATSAAQREASDTARQEGAELVGVRSPRSGTQVNAMSDAIAMTSVTSGHSTSEGGGMHTAAETTHSAVASSSAGPTSATEPAAGEISPTTTTTLPAVGETNSSVPAVSKDPVAERTSTSSNHPSAHMDVADGWWWLLALLLLLIAVLLWLHRVTRRKQTAVKIKNDVLVPGHDIDAPVAENLDGSDTNPPQPVSVFHISTRPRPVVNPVASARVVDLSSRRLSPQPLAANELISLPEASEPSVDTLESRLIPSPGDEKTPPAATVAFNATDAIAEAKQLLTNHRFEEALAALEETLARPDAPAEAWTIAGWSWWRISQSPDAKDPAHAATQAARAIEHALRAEPQRADLMTRLARCHLLRAQHAQTPHARSQCLDQALQMLGRRSAIRADDAADQLEYAQTLKQRAEAAPLHEQAEWWKRADNALHAIPARQPEAIEVEVRRLRTDVDIALAKNAGGSEAEQRYTSAMAELSDELARADDSTRDAWLHKLLDTARERIQRLQGGSRILQLQAVKTLATPYLETTSAVAPLLSWINLLDDWASQLQGRNAQIKLAEADALFARVGTLPARGQAGIQFARAYYLRLRSRHEHGAARQRTLQQASSVLQELPSGALPEALITLENAEIQLRMASTLEAPDNAAMYRSAASQAQAAALATNESLPAWICAAKGLSELANLQPLRPEEQAQLSDIGRQLELAVSVPEAMGTAARIRLIQGDYAISSELCDNAWRAGAVRDDILPIWRDANERWARSLPDSASDPRWRQSHMRMRLANSSH